MPRPHPSGTPASPSTAPGRQRRGWQALALAWLLLLALASLPALAQTGGTPPPIQQPRADRPAPARGGGMGVGVQVDVGQLFQLGRRLLATADAPEAYVPGALLVAFPVEAGLDPAALAADAGARLTAQARLDELGLVVAQLQTAPEQVAAVQQALQARHPELTADRAPWWYPQQAGPALPGSRPGRLYATALLGIDQPQPLPQPVRVAMLDGAVEPAIGLELAGFEQVRIASSRDPDPGQHGTAVACLLACRPRGPANAAFFGPSPGLILLNAAVLGRDAQGRPQARALDVLRGLDWSLRSGAQVLNVSLGAAPDAVTARAFALARPKLAAIVAAAGNGGADGGLVYPAALPGVIAVAAMDARLRPYRDGTRGSWITLAAPGVEVWVPGRADDGGRYVSGTSFAAPFVTAWVAQRLARGLPVDAATLCANARDVPPAGRDVQTGCGLLQWGGLPR